MEQQEEKRLEVYKRRRGQSSSMSKPYSSFPLDLASEILLKLPAKSIVRSRCISKLWSSITTDPYFIKSFETRSLSKPSLLLFFKRMDKLCVFSFPQHHQNSNERYGNDSSPQPLDIYQMKCPKYFCFSFMESVHGLICFRKLATPIIWNPTMRQFLTLTKPDKTWRSIGYDPIEGKHKVVCLPGDKIWEDCRVLTLGSGQEQWRSIKTSLDHHPYTDSYGRCINGVLYYKAGIDNLSGQSQAVIMSFDVRSEKFHAITLPVDTIRGLLIAYEGRLALVHSDYDAEKHKWSDKSFPVPFSHTDPVLKAKFKLSGITDAGEFIYLPSTFLRSFYIKYYDPKRNSFRTVEFKGVADREFRHKSGLGNRRVYALQTFPNHMDNLISLCNT
ncbi:hypothetical protein ARALYDRAFT_315031 [Arabidopsis lyrata subsp. lyrata]|uniref:F-box domain-containing protein n=1 Tax=Arabidopsis lyrata subsp. lyrata TaxID=81972 RepID=D7KSX0_ARALL|nr:hypothetical protein ARALYDRAFT_315031 [Arabidopsis lyrata subsp. lyrata]